jgi:hypothetical protein
MKTIPIFTYQKSSINIEYYILVTVGNNGYNTSRRDKWISNLIGLEKQEFRNYMKTLFNGKLINFSNNTKCIHFKNEEDAKAAVEWIEATRILSRLRG